MGAGPNALLDAGGTEIGHRSNTLLGIRRSGLLLVLGLAALQAEPLHGQKTDTLVLQNGDRITGEIKGLFRGKLDYNTDDAGRLSIEWVKIIRLTSRHYFEVEVASGAKYFGRLAEADRDGEIVVELDRADTLAVLSVVRISTLDAAFLQRLTAYLDVGFSFAKANKATTFNLAAEAKYRGARYGSTIYVEAYAQGQEAVPTTTRNTGEINGTIYLPDRWSIVGLAQAEQNDELNLALRFTLGGAASRVFRQSNSGELAAAAGVVVTRERFQPAENDSTATEEEQTNLEGLLYGQWDAFRYDSPKLDFSTSLSLYPSLSSLGRLRGELAMRIKYEVFRDFNVGLKFTDTFDSDPPDETASKNDFISSVTIGWSYRR